MVKLVGLIKSTDKKAEDEFDEKWHLSSTTIEYTPDGQPQPKRPGFKEIIVDISDISDTEDTEHTKDTEDTMPRKSNVSQASATGPSTSAASEEAGAVDANGNGKEKEGISVEDLALPRTMVQRIAKGVLPPNTQIQKDALTAISKSATVFVNHLSHHANEVTATTNRRTIAPQDVFEALRNTEMAHMIPRLEAELAKYNEIQTAKRNEYRKKVKDNTSGVGREIEGGSVEGSVNEGGGVYADNTAEEIVTGSDSDRRGKKRVRLDPETSSKASAATTNCAGARTSVATEEANDDEDADNVVEDEDDEMEGIDSVEYEEEEIEDPDEEKAGRASGSAEEDDSD